jgi:hypothetical protein
MMKTMTTGALSLITAAFVAGLVDHASAQELVGPQRPTPPPSPVQPGPTDRTPRVVFATQGGYDNLQRAGAGAGLFIPMQRWTCGDGICGGPVIELQATAGVNGWRVAAGPALMGFPFWLDTLATVTRTRSTAVAGGAESTYVGVDAGLAFPVSAIGECRKAKFVDIRPSIGVAHRVRGPAGLPATTFTWGVGAHILWPKS